LYMAVVVYQWWKDRGRGRSNFDGLLRNEEIPSTHEFSALVSGTLSLSTSYDAMSRELIN
jgi:hypothetical protein